MNFVNKRRAENLLKNSVLLSMLSELEEYQTECQVSKKNFLQGETMYPAPAGDPPELFCCFSPELNFTFVNEAYCQVFNKNREELIGASILSLAQEQYHNEISNLLHSLTAQQPVIHAEYTWTACNGKAKRREWIGRAIFNESGCLYEYQAIGQDITEQKEAEEQICYRLKLEEALARTSRILIDPGEGSINEIIRILGEAVASNRTYIFGTREDGVTCDNTYEWCDAETKPQIKNLQGCNTLSYTWLMNKLLQGENVIITDIGALPPEAIAEKEGFESQGILSMLMVPIRSSNGELQGAMGFDDTKKCRQWKNEDIRCLSLVAEMLGAYWERKEIEKALRDSEVNFRTLADTAPALIYVCSQSDNDYRLVYLNSGYKTIMGYSSEEGLAMGWRDLIHPDYQQLAQERVEARMRGDIDNIRYETRFLCKNGKEIWGDLSASPIQWKGKPAVLGIVYDITERKQMEDELLQARNELENRVKERTTELSIVNEKLQQEIAAHWQAEQELALSEARYRAIVEDQSEMVIRALPDTTLTFVNEALARFFGKETEYFIGNSLLASIVKEDQLGVMQKLSALSPENPDTVDTVRLIQKRGKVCWHEWTSRAIFEDRKLVEYQAGGRDVTERKKAEEALAQSEVNFKKLAETSPALIFVFNEDRLLYMNSTAKFACNCSDEDISNMNPWELVHPDYHVPLRQAGIARRRGELVAPYEARLIGKNGSEMWGYLSADIIDYEGQEAILGVIMDISERKKMEEDLLKASKLESLGILAGGIAHDFNNILTVISGNISLAKMIMELNPEIYELLNEVEKASFQARDLTQQLLTFSKGGAPIKETASIQEILFDSVSFVLRGSNVSCSFAIPEDLWAVSIDKGQISQVINNLIINADQAMPEGGTIQLLAENFCNPVASLALQAGNYVKISIRDQGIGIAEKHLAKVFDPYFTTKQKGHGLGLATCYSIIKKHAGDITINSRLGKGTTINVYLPASPHDAVVKKNIAQTTLFGQGKILLMDDEPIVRETLGRMLKHLGYHIDFASNGQEAIEQYTIAKDAGELYDAVIMDLTIAGGMGGKEACNKLRQIDEQVKVLVSSGYSNDPVMADYKKYGFCGVIPKPYAIDGLNQALYEVIMNKADS